MAPGKKLNIMTFTLYNTLYWQSHNYNLLLQKQITYLELILKMATGLFKIALVFASLVATIELSDARDNIDGSGVFKYHPWDKFWGDGISGDIETKKKSRSKRFGFFGSCYAKYGLNKMIHVSEDSWCGCRRPPCGCKSCSRRRCIPIAPSKFCLCSPSTPCFPYWSSE